jgi:hypothetical protein
VPSPSSLTHTCCSPPFLIHPAGAADYDTLLRRHQALEASHAKAQDSLAELRQRLEGLTGPGGPAAKAKQAQARVEQVRRGEGGCMCPCLRGSVFTCTPGCW